MMRLEDAISIAPYIRSIAADVRGVGRMMRVCMMRRGVWHVYVWCDVVYGMCMYDACMYGG